MANYTRDTPKEVQLPVRLPLVGVLNQRSDSGGIDSRLINGYVEKGQDGEIRVTKRPGLSVAYTSTGVGYGCAFLNNTLYYVFGTALIGTPIGGSPIGIATVMAGYKYTFREVSLGLSARGVLLTNGIVAYVIEPGGGARQISVAGTAVGPVTCSITNTSTTVTTADTTLFTKYSDVTGIGIAANTTIASIDSSTQFTLSIAATATNASAALSFTLAGLPTYFGAPSDSQLWAPQAVELNKSVYMVSIHSELVGSDPDDPFAWNPLNKIVAYADLGLSIALSKQLSYPIVFKGTNMEFFRDEGNSPGSPLARIEGMRADVGCAYCYALQEIDDKLLWVSSASISPPSVWMLHNGKYQEVATPAVKRLLDGITTLNTFAFGCEGHLFYCINLTGGSNTLVYDITSDYWSYWTSASGGQLPFVAAAYSFNALTGGARHVYLQHATDGKIYELDLANVTDVGSTFDMDIYPPEFDANMLTSKYLSKMYVSGDQQTGRILKVRVNDNNQQPGSWTNWREFDLSSARPRIDECGSFYKRSFHFRHSSATRCRIEAVEMDLQPGTL